MTKELQHAMAQYEEARIVYRKAVLGSLQGANGGDDIRAAIQAFQVARAELARHGGAPGRTVRTENEPAEPTRWSFARWLPRMLKAS
jgi:hypothetical protein